MDKIVEIEKIAWSELSGGAWPSHSQVVRFAALRMMHGTVRVDKDGNLAGERDFVTHSLVVAMELSEGLKKSTREGQKNNMSRGAHEQFLWLMNYSDPCSWGLENGRWWNENSDLKE